MNAEDIRLYWQLRRWLAKDRLPRTVRRLILEWIGAVQLG